MVESACSCTTSGWSKPGEVALDPDRPARGGVPEPVGAGRRRLPAAPGPGGEVGGAAGGLLDPGPVQPAVGERLDDLGGHLLDQLGVDLRADAEQVGAGGQGADGGRADAAGGQRGALHLQRVGDHGAGEAVLVRSRSTRTARLKVAGPSPVSAGTRMCAVMIARTPASTTAANGGRSRSRSSAADTSTVGSSWWESATVAPWPGKCLAQAATPADWRPDDGGGRVGGHPGRVGAERAGADDRVVVGGVDVDGRGQVDGDAERGQLARRSPRRPGGSASTSSTAPSAALPGYGLPVAWASRVTSPPSSSMAISTSGRPARSAAVLAATWAGSCDVGAEQGVPGQPVGEQVDRPVGRDRPRVRGEQRAQREPAQSWIQPHVSPPSVPRRHECRTGAAVPGGVAAGSSERSALRVADTLRAPVLQVV